MGNTRRAMFSPEGMGSRQRQRRREAAQAALFQPVLPALPEPSPAAAEPGDIREGDIRPVGGGQIVTTRQLPRAQRRRRARWADPPDPPPPPPPPGPPTPTIRRPTGRAGGGRQVIKLHRSDTAGNLPTGLQPGEVSIEYASTPPVMYVGVETAIAASGRKRLGEPVIISDTEPSPAAPGTLWWDSVSGQLFIRFDDGTSSQWVSASSGAGETGIDDLFLPLAGGVMSGPITGSIVTVGGSEPAAPRLAGQFWFDNSGSLLLWGGSGWTRATGPTTFTSNTQPSNPINGDLWFNPDTNDFRVWNGVSWQDATHADTVRGFLPLTGGTLTGDRKSVV